MKHWSRISIYVFALLVPPLFVGLVGFVSSQRGVMARLTDAQSFSEQHLPAPTFDPTKPTVAVLLGNDLTQVTDFLAPYEIFAASRAFNVYAVAPQRKLTTLTGGLDIMPHFSLVEFDAQVPKGPAIIVIPHIPNIRSAENRPILEWIKRHATERTVLLSWCTGAGELAATGLLNGRSATTHWGDIGRLERQYPEVEWVRGVRYVDNGKIVTSAGLTSGIDATLHVLAKLKGIDVARTVARDLHYPSYAFVETPKVEQYTIELNDAIYLLNAAYQWMRTSIGVLLYDGVSEIALASVFDTYASSYTANTLTLAPLRQMITTKYKLHLVPRWDFARAPSIERLLVPGNEARQHATPNVKIWEDRQSNNVVFLHADAVERFALDAPLMDLARQQNVLTAKFAAKRFEYRADTIQFAGPGWPLLLVLRPIVIGLVSLGVVIWLERFILVRQKRNQH